MPRKPRIHFTGAVYHVILRGNAGQDIFYDAADRSRFFLLLQQGTVRFGHRIHAFCLMTNHIHLALQVGEVPLARIMQNLGFRYTQFVNLRHGRKGHLFQGRYKALLIDVDAYLLELVRYLHLNPVRAGMVVHPDVYPWSSHHAYLGRQPIPWLTTGWVLSQFSGRCQDAISRYRLFIDEGLLEGHRREFHRGTFEGRILGDDTFIDEVMVQTEETIQYHPTLDAVLAAVCQAYDLAETDLASSSRARPVAEARAVSALLVRETPGLILVELAKRLGQDASSISQAARRLDERIKAGDPVLARLKDLREQFPACQA